MNQTKPLPPSRLSVELGSLFYCCLTEIVRKRLTPGELAKLYPQYPKALRFQHPYYIDHDGDSRRLAMIRVELSGSANRILDKHLKNLYMYRDKYPAIGSMLDQGQLMLVTLSPSNEVLAELQRLLQDHPWYPPSRTFHIPDLWNFLPLGK